MFESDAAVVGATVEDALGVAADIHANGLFDRVDHLGRRGGKAVFEIDGVAFGLEPGHVAAVGCDEIFQSPRFEGFDILGRQGRGGGDQQVVEPVGDGSDGGIPAGLAHLAGAAHGFAVGVGGGVMLGDPVVDAALADILGQTVGVVGPMGEKNALKFVPQILHTLECIGCKPETLEPFFERTLSVGGGYRKREKGLGLDGGVIGCGHGLDRHAAEGATVVGDVGIEGGLGAAAHTFGGGYFVGMLGRLSFLEKRAEIAFADFIRKDGNLVFGGTIRTREGARSHIVFEVGAALHAGQFPGTGGGRSLTGLV